MREHEYQEAGVRFSPASLSLGHPSLDQDSPTAISIIGERALAALADPTRRAIFVRTLSAPRPVCDIACGLPVSRVAVSQHLKVLKEAGLVTCQRDGPRRLYRADPRAIGALVSMMNTIWRKAAEMRAPHAADGDL